MAPSESDGSDSSNSLTPIPHIVSSLQRLGRERLHAIASSLMVEVSLEKFLDWMAMERLSWMPHQADNYDKMLRWSTIFSGRLQMFGSMIGEFAGDTNMAVQLAYSYCAMLLESGRDKTRALMVPFHFFYDISMQLEIIGRAEGMMSSTKEIRELLVLALGDLVILVACVSVHFYQAIRGLSGKSVSININTAFLDQIETFRERCDKIMIAMSRYQLLRENIEPGKVSELKPIRSWLVWDDPIITGLIDTTAMHLVREREERTCLWINGHIRKLRKGQWRTIHFTGRPGTGKSILASVIVDALHQSRSGVSFVTLFVPINARIPATTTLRFIAHSILHQLFIKSVGNVPLLRVLSDAFERSKRVTNGNDYDSLLWDTLKGGLEASHRSFEQLALILDGVDEASCDEADLLQKLALIIAETPHVSMVTFGMRELPPVDGEGVVNIVDGMTFEDISATVRRDLQPEARFSELSEAEQEKIIIRIVEASEGSFIWASLATNYARFMMRSDECLQAVDALESTKLTLFDLVLLVIQMPDVSFEAKQVVLWLAITERPLSIKEVFALSSVSIDAHAVEHNGIDILRILEPLHIIVSVQDDMLCIRHNTIRLAVIEIFSQGKLIPTKDPHADLVTRLFIYIKVSSTEPSEPTVKSLDKHDIQVLLDKHPLLDFALRYWPTHFRRTSVFQDDGLIGASKEFTRTFPPSTTFVRLQTAIWEMLPIFECIGHLESLTDIFREAVGTNHAATLQCLICLASKYRQIGQSGKAASMFYEAFNVSNSLLTGSHSVTLQLAETFLDLTGDEISRFNAEKIAGRDQCLSLLEEHRRANDASTSREM